MSDYSERRRAKAAIQAAFALIRIDESGEVHLSAAIRIIQIPSEKWDVQGVGEVSDM